MTFAFIIAFIVAGTFFFLWQDTKEKLEEAEKQIRKLKKQQKQQKQQKPQQKTVKKNTGLATIEKSEATGEYTIPKPGPQPAGPILDPRKLAELQEETKVAQSMLAEIFVQEEVAVQPDVKPDEGRLTSVLERLLDKDVWTRAEIAELVGPDVMIGNLLEKINDYACSKIDDIVLEEDGDRIYVTTEYKEQLI